MGLIFDFFRAVRKKIKTGALAVGLQDVLFFIISAALVFLFMYRANYAEPCWYVFLGIVLGIVLYNATVSRLIIKIFVWLFDFIVKFITILFRIISIPIKLLYRVLRVPVVIICIPLRKAVRFILRKFTCFFEKIINNLKKIRKTLKMY